MRYRDSVRQLLLIEKNIGALLLLEDVIEPTLDSINRLIDVLTGVGGQLRESSLGVISRMVNNKKTLNIRELDVRIYASKQKLEQLNEDLKKLEGPNGEQDEDDPNVQQFRGEISGLKQSIKVMTDKKKLVQQSLYSLGTQNLLFKLAFARMNEIATQFGGKDFPVEPIVAPPDLGDISDTDTLPNVQPAEQELDTVFVRLSKEFQRSVEGANDRYFRAQKKAGIGGLFIQEVFNDGVMWLENTKQRIEQAQDPDFAKKMLELAKRINLKFIIEVTQQEHTTEKERIKRDLGLQLSGVNLTKFIVTQKISDEFYARVQEIVKLGISTVVKGKDVNDVVKILRQIPSHVLLDVASEDPATRKHFADVSLSPQVLPILTKAIETYKQRYPNAADPENEVAKFLYAQKIGLQGAADDIANTAPITRMGQDPHDTLVDLQASVQTDQEREDLAKLQAIIDKAQTTQQLDQIKTAVVTPTKSDEFNQGATTLIDLKRDTMVTPPHPDAVGTSVGISIEDVAANIVKNGAVTDQDITNAAIALRTDDYELVTQPLLKLIGKNIGNNPNEFVRFSNEITKSAADLKFRKDLNIEPINSQDEPYKLLGSDEIRGSMGANNEQELTQHLINLQNGYEQFTKLLEWEGGHFVRERWKGIIQDKTWEKVNIQDMEKFVSDFAKKNEVSLNILQNNKDINGLLNVYKVFVS